MMRVRIVHIIAAMLLLGLKAGAQESEVNRLSGFAQHQNNNVRFDRAREKGERAYFEELEQWENQKNRDLESFKKEKKAEAMPDDSIEAKADARAKKAVEEAYEDTRQEYVVEKSKKKDFSRQAMGLPSEEQELGLDQLRPRYEYKKRAFFGGKAKYGKSSSPPSSGGGGSSYGGSSGGSFPPPPTFDDFGDSGYVPAPNMSDDFGDVPPPPPPPPPFGDDGFGSGSDFPPPPPPPPPFGEDSGEF